MKNRRKETTFTREDFDSFFLRKVFWKLIKEETPLVFFLKVLTQRGVFCGTCFYFISDWRLRKKYKRRASYSKQTEVVSSTFRAEKHEIDSARIKLQK